MKSPFTFDYTAPTTPENGKLYPAIFLMHGMGSNEKDLPVLFKELKNDYHIFSLRGPIEQGQGYAFFTDEEFGKPMRAIFDKIVLHVKAFIDEAIQEYAIDANNVFLAGFSQGAVLTQTLALAIGGERLAGTVILSGYLPQHVKEEYGKHSVKGLPMLITHGTMDYVLPLQWGKETSEFFIEYGAKVNYLEFEDGHGVTPEVNVAIINFIKENTK